MLEQVRVYDDAKSRVPAVIANVVQLAELPSVTVKVVLMVSGPNDALLNVYVTLACGVGVNVRYAPADDNVKLLTMFRVVVPGLNDVDPKFRFLYHPAVVNVPTLAPVVNVRLIAFEVVPPVVPYVNVLVLPMSATVNPPGPVYENPVTVAMLSTTVAAVVWVRLMFPAVVVPKPIERVLVLFELNIPVDRITLSAKVNVPAVKVYVPVAVSE